MIGKRPGDPASGGPGALTRVLHEPSPPRPAMARGLLLSCCIHRSTRGSDP